MYPLHSRARAGRDLTAALVLLLLTAGGLAGCASVGEAMQQGVNRAAGAAGEQVGRAVGQQLAPSVNLPAYGTAQWNRFMAVQAQVIFNYAFSAGGMWPAEAAYEEGEWATYAYSASEGDTGLDTIERAFLTTTADGNQWWRVRAQTEEGEAWVYEALLNPEQGEVVRLRTRDPEGNVGEVPVGERTIYQSPQELTEESIEGATTGTEELSTPAGTFTTDRVEYQQGTGTLTWFMTEEVPGHIARYQVDDREGQTWTATLQDYGSDATTVLDSYGDSDADE
jgi:hypothetical protein